VAAPSAAAGVWTFANLSGAQPPEGEWPGARIDPGQRAVGETRSKSIHRTHFLPGDLVMTILDLSETSFSRRMLLRKAAVIAVGGAAFGAAIAASAASAATAPAKKPQGAVAYQATPKGSARCNACDQFQQPSACKTVTGVINPTGWCNLYSPKW
jgi:hypothetical protein